MTRVIKHMQLATVVIGLVTCRSAVSRADEAVEPVAVSLSHISVDYLCGQTPTPDQPPPHCPTTGTMALTYLGQGCTAGDFVIKLRQRPNDQVLRVFKRAAATGCIVDDSGLNGSFSTLTVGAPDIDVTKPLRLANPLAIYAEPRP